MLLGTSKKSVSIMDISNNGIFMQDGKARICRDSEKNTRTHFDWIGVPDEFVDIIGLSTKLPGVML